MFQAGTYKIEQEGAVYGYLEVTATGEDSYELKFYSANSSAEWPLPKPTAAAPYTFEHSTDDLPDQLGDGVMNVTTWEPATAADLKTRQIQPGPCKLDIGGTLVFIALNTGSTTDVLGFYGVGAAHSEWPIILPANTVATLSVGTAETPAQVAAESDAAWGKNWNPRGLSEQFSS